jgi:hypothetical protein
MAAVVLQSGRTAAREPAHEDGAGPEGVAVRAGWRDPVRVTVWAVVEHVPSMERPFEASISDPEPR